MTTLTRCYLTLFTMRYANGGSLKPFKNEYTNLMLSHKFWQVVLCCPNAKFKLAEATCWLLIMTSNVISQFSYIWPVMIDILSVQGTSNSPFLKVLFLKTLYASESDSGSLLSDDINKTQEKAWKRWHATYKSNHGKLPCPPFSKSLFRHNLYCLMR